MAETKVNNSLQFFLENLGRSIRFFVVRLKVAVFFTIFQKLACFEQFV